MWYAWMSAEQNPSTPYDLCRWRGPTLHMECDEHLVSTPKQTNSPYPPTAFQIKRLISVGTSALLPRRRLACLTLFPLPFSGDRPGRDNAPKNLSMVV